MTEQQKEELKRIRNLRRKISREETKLAKVIAEAGIKAKEESIREKEEMVVKLAREVKLSPKECSHPGWADSDPSHSEDYAYCLLCHKTLYSADDGRGA